MITELPSRQRLLIRAGGALLAIAFVTFALHAALVGGAGALFNTWVYCGLMLAAAASCLARALLVARERLAWALLGAGLALWTGGEIFFSVALAGMSSVPIPSPADAGYLAFYPLAYAGLIVLLRERIGSFPVARWLDGLIVGTAVAALLSALALGPILAAGADGSTLAVITNLTYPIADLTLLGLVITAAAFTGWRPGLSLLILGGGFVVLAVSDGTYLLQSAQGTYTEGGALDAGWPLGALLLATAAWVSPGSHRVVAPSGLRVALVPALAALVAIGIQAAGQLTDLSAFATVLSLITLVIVVVRLGLSLRESQASLQSSQREATTDALTGLDNRRALMSDLSAAAEKAPVPRGVWLLAMFDLDGFKAYNDSFGHRRRRPARPARRPAGRLRQGPGPSLPARRR